MLYPGKYFLLAGLCSPDEKVKREMYNKIAPCCKGAITAHPYLLKITLF